MSGAARKRAAGRATGGTTSSESSSRRGDRLGQGGFSGGFDGPASRGSASNVGSGHGTSPNAPQGGFAPQNPPTASRRSSQSGSGAAPNLPAAPLGDPARDRPSRYTDQLRNVDLPPSFYNIDQLVGEDSPFNAPRALIWLPLLAHCTLNTQDHLPSCTSIHSVTSSLLVPSLHQPTHPILTDFHPCSTSCTTFLHRHPLNSVLLSLLNMMLRDWVQVMSCPSLPRLRRPLVAPSSSRILKGPDPVPLELCTQTSTHQIATSIIQHVFSYQRSVLQEHLCTRY